MNDMFELMLSAYPADSQQDRRNATYEVMQQVVLAGLYRGGFFKEAAFYGGTCLRIFHRLNRFSENMDFSLLRKNPDFKFERDTLPPLDFQTEQKLLMQPYSFMTRCITLPDLYAGKMHAMVFRKWKTRIKGRDWYDFEWYVHHRFPLNFSHLQTRVSEFNGIELSRDSFMEMLRERLASADIEEVKVDVRPYLRDTRELDIWSNDYYLQLADMMAFA